MSWDENRLAYDNKELDLNLAIVLLGVWMHVPSCKFRMKCTTFGSFLAKCVILSKCYCINLLLPHI